ncbi:dienelactone hydrolase family protein [Halanaerobium saccharolyticum]|uniref:Dienelactone hydrolase family protein n=1 Tax=Halanaerobium saccharolyticum TaxID=43595 RepID=A0A4R6LFY6_9FIRM|nr:alpha/beta hydrolase [Halanaerobium saccharolyticum]TDO78334.1 dienelactone hydrolase family protein [Halanaerobium saccharolyticum]
MLLWQIQDYLTTFLSILKAKIKNRKLADILQAKKYKYGEDKKQYLLWYNSQSESKRNNIVFFIHGGGWNKGSPEFFKFVADYFTKLGFITVMPTYRLAPDSQFPDQQIDVFKALKKTFDILEKSNLSQNIIIAGQSAGAHLGSLLLLNKSLQKKYKINKDRLSAFLSISGPLDLSRPCRTIRAKKYLSDFVPTSHKRKQANPTNYIRPDFKTSIFCLHGAKDPLVPKAHSIDFIEEIKTRTQAETKLKIYDNKHHSDLSDLFFKEGSASQEVKEWLLKVDNLN